ncbi:MAG: DUF2341 domain-containing protein [Candidatus Bathyarchaeia archaeon]|jgi:hypothetical protein
MSWLSGRNYRRSHVITHAANAGTGYQIKIIVHEGNGTTLNNTNEIYCNGHCRSDFNDIRFTKSDGTTKLPYWLETYSNGTAVFWVKITDDLSTTDQTIYVYYDNNSTEPSESTTSTFLAWRDLADDFNAALGTVSLTTYSNPNDPGDYFITPQTVGSVSVNPCIYFRSWGGKKYSVSSNNLYFEGYENCGNYGLCGIDIRNRTSAATAGWQTSMAYVPNTTLSKKHIVVLNYSKAGNDGYLSFHSSWSTNSDDIPEGTTAQGHALTATSQTVTEYSYGGDLSHIRLVSVSGDQLTVYSFIYAIANYVSTEPGDGVWGSEETGSVGEDLEVTGNLTVDGNATINNQLTGSSATFTGLTINGNTTIGQQLTVSSQGNSGGLVLGLGVKLYPIAANALRIDGPFQHGSFIESLCTCPVVTWAQMLECLWGLQWNSYESNWYWTAQDHEMSFGGSFIRLRDDALNPNKFVDIGIIRWDQNPLDCILWISRHLTVKKDFCCGGMATVFQGALLLGSDWDANDPYSRMPQIELIHSEGTPYSTDQKRDTLQIWRNFHIGFAKMQCGNIEVDMATNGSPSDLANPSIILKRNGDTKLSLYHDGYNGFLGAGAGDLVLFGSSTHVRPLSNNTYLLGDQSFKWKEIWAVTTHFGDAVFANGWRLTEDLENNGVLLVRTDGTIAQRWC